MKILATNDDGIFADGLKALAGELKSIADVIVVAPDRELHSMGASISLHKPVRARKAAPVASGVESYAVEGTPADCVILALGKLAKGKIDLVVSGVNRGLNLGDDVLISGTVGAALQGSVHGLPSIAVSTSLGDTFYFDDAAKFAALLAQRFESGVIPASICLNVNLPNLPREKIRGVKLTYPASRNHTDTVEERYESKRQYYWFVRQWINKPTDEKTDSWAIEKGNISISPLLPNLGNKPQPSLPASLCSELFSEFKQL
ncbi:5'-nucleotidase SurE [subsurface metagenome]